MARGYRTSPYPEVFLLKELKRLGFGAIISTDCHDSACLDYGYQEAVELLKKCGFKEQFIFTKDGFIPIEL
jgi:histidinol-phosphatase (PHP family)